MPVTNITLVLEPYNSEPALYKIVQRSYGPNNRLNFSIVNPDGTPYNIQTLYGNNPTVQMVLYRFDKIPQIFKPCVIDSLTGGTCHYDPIAGDFIVTRTKYYWLRISLQDGNPGSNQELTQEVLIEVV